MPGDVESHAMSRPRDKSERFTSSYTSCHMEILEQRESLIEKRLEHGERKSSLRRGSEIAFHAANSGVASVFST
jgi:hypothetical protein